MYGDDFCHFQCLRRVLNRSFFKVWLLYALNANCYFTKWYYVNLKIYFVVMNEWKYVDPRWSSGLSRHVFNLDRGWGSVRSNLGENLYRNFVFFCGGGGGHTHRLKKGDLREKEKLETPDFFRSKRNDNNATETKQKAKQEVVRSNLLRLVAPSNNIVLTLLRFEI